MVHTLNCLSLPNTQGPGCPTWTESPNPEQLDTLCPQGEEPTSREAPLSWSQPRLVHYGISTFIPVLSGTVHSVGMECSLSSLSTVAAPSHRWLPHAWNAVSVTGEQDSST